MNVGLCKQLAVHHTEEAMENQRQKLTRPFQDSKLATIRKSSLNESGEERNICYGMQPDTG